MRPGARGAAADYRFRAWLPRAEVARVVGELVLAISATNFKASIRDQWRHSVYFDVCNACPTPNTGFVLVGL